jgi:adenylate kinase
MARKLAIAVSGTPGTGKTTFAQELSKRLGAKLIDLSSLIEESGIYKPDKDGTRVVEPEELRKEFARVTKGEPGPLVVEGLLAHLLPKEDLTHVVVLRTRPAVLENRLKGRGYTGKKLADNLEAEVLSIILWEAVKEHGEEKVYEIDTTELGTAEAVKTFLDSVERKVSLRPGKIDWLEEYFKG